MSEAKDKTIAFNVRLKPSESSAHPRATNYMNVAVAQGIAYLDFGFIEPTLLAAIAEDVKGWPGRAERTGRSPRHPRGDERRRACAATSADSASTGHYARLASGEAEGINAREMMNGKYSI